MRVIEALDEVEDRERRFSLSLEAMTDEQLALERGVEAFTHRVIVAVTDRTHRGLNAGLSTTHAEGNRGVLRALVRMMDDGFRFPTIDCHIESIDDKLFSHVIRRLSPYNCCKSVARWPPPRLQKIDVATDNLRGTETMTDYDLTLSRDAIPGLLEQPAALGKLVETILNQVLEAQMREHLGADRYERSSERYINAPKGSGFKSSFRVGAVFAGSAK